MADNVNVTPGTGATIAADEVPAASGIFFQRVKPTFGADGTAVDQAIAAAGIPKVGDSDSLGQVQYNFPAGFVRTTDEPRQLFYDPFDAALDTTNRWNAATASGGGVAAAVASGILTLGSGTTASGISYLGSVPTFVPTVPAWLGASFAISLENPLGNNASRFWGVGTSPGTPTAAIPITDGVGFEIDTTGTLNAVVFANGTRTVVSALTAPGDTASHRYIVYIRTDRTFWYVDALTTPVATSSFQAPNVQTLPVKLSAVAHTSGPASSRVISCTGLAVWDTGKNNTQLSDGTFPWRKATIKAASTAVAATDSPLAVGLHPTSPLPVGSNTIGAVTGVDTTLGATVTPKAASTWDVSDRAARLAGVVYGSQGQQLKQTATNFNAQVEVAVGGTLVDPRSIRALTTADAVTVTQGTLTKGTQGATGVTVQELKDAGRNQTNYFMAAGVAGTTTDTLMSLTGYKGGAAVGATTTPAVVTTGKTYRIQAITLTYQSLSTAGGARVSLRANLSGVAAITSPLVIQHTIGSAAAVAGLITTEQVDIPDGLEFAAGTGIGISQIGLGTAATALASGFLTATITGYEY